MLRNLIFAWPGILAETTDLLFHPERNPELLLEEMRERSRQPFDSFESLADVAGASLVRLRPQALEFLRFCRTTRRRLFSLGRRPERNVAHLFEATYFPGHDALAKILRDHSLVAAETAFIGHSAPQVAAARAASLQSIALSQSSLSAAPDVIVRDLNVLQSLLETAPPNDEIRIEELEIFARVGVPGEERAEPQRLALSANLQPPHAFDELRDDLARTVDYAAVSQELREFVRQREDRLIETLADAMAEHLLARFDLQRVELELRKFVLPKTRYVAVRLARFARA